MKQKAGEILRRLTASGYEAYFVGGCVRDAQMRREGMEPAETGDVDVATSALPWQVREVFAGWKVVETGARHGTMTVLMPAEQAGGQPLFVEITTYREDGRYSDGRHPDQVKFVTSLTADLARRDFTINAMACDQQGLIVDPFGGRKDLQQRMIRAVGDPQARFQEDALRILRALRFAAVLDFSIEGETEAALLREKHLLCRISPERIFSELKKLLAGNGAGNVIRRYADVLGEVIPELSAMQGFLQHNPYHKYDVLEHCIRAMEQVRVTEQNGTYMKLAALFHDVGKPLTYSEDPQGIGHFYGHPARGRELTREILTRLKADGFTTERTALLVKRHDLLFEKDEGLLKRWMNRLTPQVLFEILEIKRADNLATGNMSEALMRKFDEIEAMMREILAQQQCFARKDLAVDGHDVIEAGAAPGPEVGRLLEYLLEQVMDGALPNDRDALLDALRRNVRR